LKKRDFPSRKYLNRNGRIFQIKPAGIIFGRLFSKKYVRLFSDFSQMPLKTKNQQDEIEKINKTFRTKSEERRRNMFSVNGKKSLQILRGKLSAGLAVFCGLLAAFGVGELRAQALVEDFAVVPVPGWTTQNNSVPVGSTGWLQGNPSAFPAYVGATNSYVAANFNNTTGTNTISNWLISPERTLSNGDVITFWTRRPSSSTDPDRLQLRLSLAGSSTDVGTGATAVGDFTTLLLDINPTYVTSGPTMYPTTWKQFTIVLSGISAPTAGRLAFRYFVENGGPTGSRSNYIGIDDFRYTPVADLAGSQHVLDFNGDGKTDFAVVRNTGGGAGGQITWFIQNNGGGGLYGAEWGISTDNFVPEDFDGDNKTDLAVWRQGAPGTAAFYILQSQDSTVRIEPFGQTGDDPSMVGDYDGDGKADPAVYRAGAASGDPSTWFYRGSLNNPAGNVTYVPWGKNGDFPAPGDYDGDGRNDFVVQRSEGFARFWMWQTTGGVSSVLFGFPTDQVVPGDYDGDGKTDIAIVRQMSGQLRWQFIPSSAPTTFREAIFGVSATDFPTPGDYDGDGKTDVAIWRPSATPGASVFWALGTTIGVLSAPFGHNTDYPPANFNTH
jgi:hypothetical protein